jgi:hypothetical protein
MASDPTLERAYPYRSGWRVIGCGVLIFGTMGGAAVALVPFGCERVQNGQMPLGVAMMVAGLFGTPMLFMALVGLVTGVRESIAPPTLRVTPTALILPVSLKGTTPGDESGEKPAEPLVVYGHPVTPPEGSRQGATHPDEIPFSAIRWVRREGPVNPGSHKLVIVHDLAPTTLVIEQYMMQWGDFDELEAVLRAAIPAAFAPAPPAGPTTGA